MEILLETALESQTILGSIHFLIFVFSWPFVIGYLKNYHDQFRFTFNCLPKPSDYTRQHCYDRYVSSLSPLLTPLDISGITFGVLGFFWVCFIITGGWLKRRIGKEQDKRRKKRQAKTFLLTFTCHVCFQFVVLLLMMVLFCGFQTLEFPASYWCTQGNITLSPTKQVLASNITCKDAWYKEKSKLNKSIITIMSLSIFLCLLTMLHLLVTWRAFLEHLITSLDEPVESIDLVAGEPGEWPRMQRHILDLDNGSVEEPGDVNTTQEEAMTKYSKNFKESREKLIRDWAVDKLFDSGTNVEVPEFKFAYLMTFRQLNLLRDTNISLRELLNRSSILDDRSNVDDSLLEHIQSHSEEVLIIINGFDEYSQQNYIASDAHDSYPNSAQDKMPVAALCAKIMRRKILGNATVIITLRPDKSDKLSGFDRVVKITGFSPQEVKEYIEKYFRENETMKNTVLDHMMKNEELLSCAHIPVLCGLICSYLEYVLNESQNVQDLPVSTNDLYGEVLKIFERKHNKGKSSDSDKISLTRTCGLLHYSPPFRAAFSETMRHFAFTHLTVQEYLTACLFVKTRVVPEKGTVSSMVLQFIAGILSKENGSRDLMGELLEALPSNFQRGNQYLLEAKCLREYRDFEFAKDYYQKHPVLDYEIHFDHVDDQDSDAISFWLDAISTVNVNRASTRCQFIHSGRVLRIGRPNLTFKGVQRICKALDNDHCPITKLRLVDFQLNDDWLPSVIKLVRYKLSSLDLRIIDLTEDGVSSLCAALQHSDCKVATLHLWDKQITDVGVASLSKALQHSDCKVTKLQLVRDQITDVGVASLSEALQHSDCKVTKLTLEGNQITDVGVASLSQALQRSDCKVTKLKLVGNKITDDGVASLSKALQHSDCKVTKLTLQGDQITDVGVASLCKALQHSDRKVTKLTFRL